MTDSVKSIAATVLALSPQERYRLAAYLFERNESALAHVVVRSGLHDEPEVLEPEALP